MMAQSASETLCYFRTIGTCICAEQRCRYAKNKTNRAMRHLAVHAPFQNSCIFFPAGTDHPLRPGGYITRSSEQLHQPRLRGRSYFFERCTLTQHLLPAPHTFLVDLRLRYGGACVAHYLSLP